MASRKLLKVAGLDKSPSPVWKRVTFCGYVSARAYERSKFDSPRVPVSEPGDKYPLSMPSKIGAVPLGIFVYVE